MHHSQQRQRLDLWCMPRFEARHQVDSSRRCLFGRRPCWCRRRHPRKVGRWRPARGQASIKRDICRDFCECCIWRSALDRTFVHVRSAREVAAGAERGTQPWSFVLELRKTPGLRCIHLGRCRFPNVQVSEEVDDAAGFKRRPNERALFLYVRRRIRREQSLDSGKESRL